MRLIDADVIPWMTGKDGDVVTYPDVIAEMPSIEPEQKMGKWIIDKDCEGKTRTITCNRCGHKEFNWHNPNYCPNCGCYNGGK